MNLNSKIGLGTVQFGVDYGISNKQGQTPKAEVANILISATEAGISIIDTASAYGNAQSVLGENNLERFKIISKFMPPAEGLSVSTQLDLGLKQLNIENFYGFLAHRPMDLLDNKRQWKELQDLRDSAKISKIGFSLNEPEELKKLTEAGMYPDLVQVPFNFFDHRFKDSLVDLKSKGCEVHTRSTFLQGLFFSDINKLPGFFDGVKITIKDLQSKYRDELAAVLLKYVLNQDYIDTVIIGVENNFQLLENIKNLSSASDICQDVHKTIADEILMPVRWPKS